MSPANINSNDSRLKSSKLPKKKKNRLIKNYITLRSSVEETYETIGLLSMLVPILQVYYFSEYFCLKFKILITETFCPCNDSISARVSSTFVCRINKGFSSSSVLSEN